MIVAAVVPLVEGDAIRIAAMPFACQVQLFAMPVLVC